MRSEITVVFWFKCLEERAMTLKNTCSAFVSLFRCYKIIIYQNDIRRRSDGDK